MENRTYEIAEKLLYAIKEKYKEDYKNIPEVLTYWHNIMFLFFTSINYRRLTNHTGKKDEEYNEMVTWGLMPKYLYDFYDMEKGLIKEYIDVALTECASINADVNCLRQELLNIQLDFSNKELGLFSDKVSRDNTGAYYTPPKLAAEVINKSFDSVSFDPLQDYRIMDFSCGGGDFFFAVLDYLKSRYSIEKSTSVKWLYGVDVDPIALQTCLVNLLFYADKKDWTKVVSHFFFGNPLLISDGEYSEKEKNTLFATRRLYSIGLGMPKSFFDHSFDIIVGNPPWEKIRFEEKKFFRGIVNGISSAPQKNERNKKVAALKNVLPIVFDWQNQVRKEYSVMNASTFKHFLINDSVVGELNTYALFTELAFNMLSKKGFLALVVKSTLATAPVNQRLWSKFLGERVIKSVFIFENKKRIFSIDSRERFIVFIAGKERFDSFEFATGLTEPNDLSQCKTIILTEADLKRINPFTSTIPNVSNNEEIIFLKNAHKQFRLFSEVYPNCHFGRLIHLTAHAASITKTKTKNNVPIYEGKFLEQYDSRYATFRGMPDSKKYANKATAIKNQADVDGDKEWPESRFFIDQILWTKYLKQYRAEYSLCWRSLTSPTNKRTMIAMILPTCPTCQSIQLLQTNDKEELILLLALFNSIPFDYFVRIKMPGLDLTQSVIKQIPVPSNDDYNDIVQINGVNNSLRIHIMSYTISILEHEEKLKDLVKDFDGIVYKITESDRDKKQKTIDLLFKKAYHLSDEEFKEILNTFPKYQAGHTV